MTFICIYRLRAVLRDGYIIPKGLLYDGRYNFRYKFMTKVSNDILEVITYK